MIVGGGTVNLEGTTTWTGNTAANNNAIQFWNGATINNKGTFNDANTFASFIEHNIGGPHNFNNIGTYNKLAEHDHDGRHRRRLQQLRRRSTSNAGSFRPSGGVTSAGTFNIAAGAVLDFKNGDQHAEQRDDAGRSARSRSAATWSAPMRLVTINGGTHTTPFALQRQRPGRRRAHLPGPGDVDRRGDLRRRHDDLRQRRRRSPASTPRCVAGGRILNLNGTTTWSGNTAANNNAIQFCERRDDQQQRHLQRRQRVRVVHRAQRRRPAQLQQPRHLQQADEHDHDGRPRRRLQQLRHAQPRRRDDAFLQRHAGPDRDGERGERRDLPARRQQHDGHAAHRRQAATSAPTR